MRFPGWPMRVLLACALVAGCGGEGGGPGLDDVGGGHGRDGESRQTTGGAPAGDRGTEARGTEARHAAPAAVAPERIVSLLPAATEILLELGSGDRLVARAEGDPALSGWTRLPSVGNPLEPSLEVLTSLRPDLLVTWSGSAPGARPGALERVLAPEGFVLGLDVQGFGDLRRAIDTLGAILDLREPAALLNRRIASSLEDAAVIGLRDRGAARAPPPTVAWVVWPDPLTLAGPGSFPDEVIAVAGADNVVRAGEGAWPVIGLETLIARDPDILVWPSGGGIPEPESVPGVWQRVPAFENGRVIRLDADRLHVPGPGLARMMPRLATAIAEVGAQPPPPGDSAR